MGKNSHTLLITNVRIVSHRGILDGKNAILVRGERIESIFDGSKAPLPETDSVIDGGGKLCFPGIVDDQVHFRDPGLTHKGDIASESSAALLGGVTSWMDMPNTKPQTTTLEAWADKMALGAEKARGNYAFYFGATNENADLLRLIDKAHTPGVKVFMGSSTGNMLVDSDEALRRIFAESPIPVALHSESEAIIRVNKEEYRMRYGEDPHVKYHPMIRSREACLESTKKAVKLAQETGAHIHILHLSTEDEVKYLSEGHFPGVTTEVCVHHLWFDSRDYDRLGTRIKWNPAIKEARDKEALRNGLKSGALDIVATDHAPHLLEEKQGGAFKAASGGPLAQFSLLMMLEMVKEGVYEYPEVADLMSKKPCTLFGVKERGEIAEGYYADLVLVDDRSTLSVTPEIIRSKCGWSPLEGFTFSHKITDVILNGTHAVKAGALDEEAAHSAAMPLLFEHPTRNK